MDQHYVPQVYLKRFAINKVGDLYTIPLKDIVIGNIKPKQYNSSAICYRKDIYKITDVSQLQSIGISDENYIESKHFSYEKKELKTLFDKFDFKRRLTKSEAIRVVNIILSIKNRNPNFQDSYNQENLLPIMNFELNKMKNEIPENIKSKIENIDDFFKLIGEAMTAKFESAEARKDLHLINLINNNQFDKRTALIENLSLCKWIILETDYNLSFNTSDNPGFSIKLNGNRIEYYNLDLLVTNYFVFPISPKCLLIINLHEKDSIYDIYKSLTYRKATFKDLMLYNFGTSTLANNIIIGNSADNLVIAREYFIKLKSK